MCLNEKKGIFSHPRHVVASPPQTHPRHNYYPFGHSNYLSLVFIVTPPFFPSSLPSLSLPPLHLVFSSVFGVGGAEKRRMGEYFISVVGPSTRSLSEAEYLHTESLSIAFERVSISFSVCMGVRLFVCGRLTSDKQIPGRRVTHVKKMLIRPDVSLPLLKKRTVFTFETVQPSFLRTISGTNVSVT